MKKIDNFTNQYSLQKTLRFKLIPEGKTLENIQNARLLEEDEHRSVSYEKVKKYLDRYYKTYLDSVLPQVHLNGVKEYAELYYRSDKTETQREEMKKREADMRKQIAKALTGNDRYKALFSKDVIRALPEYLTDEEEIKCAKEFWDFSTYFMGFFENRKNMFTDEEKSTGIANRCVGENLPRFLDNARIFPKIFTALQDKAEEIDATFCGLFGVPVADMFTADYFTFVLSQDGIDAYNQVIGGYTNEDGSKVQGLNEYINLYNQQTERSERLPKLKLLYKQILSEGSTVSFVPEKFENDQAVLEAICTYMSSGENDDSIETLLEKLQGLVSQIAVFNPNGIFVKNDTKLTTVSKGAFGEWSAVRSAWEEEYDSNVGYKDTDAYLEKRQKAYKSIPSFSLSEIERLGKKKSSEAIENPSVFPWIIGQFGEAIGEVKTAYEKAKSLLSVPYSHAKKLCQNDDAILQIKNLLDGIKELEHTAELLMGTGKEENKDDAFYGDYVSYFDRLSRVDKLYDRVRNHLTQKPFSTEKFKLNFNNPQFLGGWDRNKETDYSGVLLRRNGMYYLAVMPKHFRRAFEQVPDVREGQEVYEKIVYKLLPGPNKMLPKVFFSRKGLEQFNPPAEILRNYQRGTHKTGENFSLTDCHKLIDFFKDAISRHPDWQQFDFHFSPTKSYRNIADFYNEVKNQGYKITFSTVSTAYIDDLVAQGNLYLFQIYNKDFSNNSHGTPNLHTLYFKALFDDYNLRNVVFKMNGESEMFYRPASIKTDEQIVHPANQPIQNKNPNSAKGESIFSYDMIKNKRYTKDQFMLHIPITINFSSPEMGSINETVLRAVQNCRQNYVIGIDRGERNLIYVCVIDGEGRIVKQYSLNDIVNEYKGQTHSTDYHALLSAKEKDRMDARKNWTAVENIKDLKEGYISQVVHKICELVEEYDAVIAMEDLNFGFKNTRSAVEKSVYQKFEKMLIDKLNFYVNKKQTDASQPGGLYRAYQLTEKFDSFKKMGKQNGFIFYVPAWLTSKIDPVTGFVDLLHPRYESVASAKEFFGKFDRIAYSPENDWFEFSFDYCRFKGGVTDFQKKWTVCSFGKRVKTFRDPKQNNEWNSAEVDLTGEFKSLFNRFGVECSADMKQAILAQNGKDFYGGLIHSLKLLLQMRNSFTGTDIDYLISPAQDTDGKFYCSNDYQGESAVLPVDADANGAYNIARKAQYLIERIKETPAEELRSLKKTVSNAEWLAYAQKR